MRPADGWQDPVRERRDLALSDLVDLERQCAAGEITAEDARSLRARYEAEAAEAMAELERRGEAPAGTSDDRSDDGRDDGFGGAPVEPARQRRVLGGTRLAYAATLLAAVVAALGVLPGAVVERPEGGLVTGNLPRDAGAPTVPLGPVEDPAAVPDADLEAAVEANPDVVGMRLALADRYAQRGDVDLALPHYRHILDRDPGNARALAGLGWIMLALGEPQHAAGLVDMARRNDPDLLEAMWFDAMIKLRGTGDPAGAVQVLEELALHPDLPAELADDVAGVLDEARRQAGQQ